MLQYELKKFFSKKMNKLILTALLLVAVIVSFLAAGSMSYTDTGEEVATGIGKLAAGRRLAADKNKWKGKLTPEKIADAAKSYQERNQTDLQRVPNSESEKNEPPLDILYFANRIYQTEADVVLTDLEHLAEKDLGHIYETYADNLQNMAKEYGETPEQEKLLTEQYKKTEIPVAYEAYDSWKTLTEDAEFYILVLVVIIGFLAAGIIDDEFQNHAERVFFTTKYGRSKAVRAKIVAGMLTTTIVYWAVIGILSLISLGLMGVSGFNTPCQMEDPYMMYDITQGQQYLLAVVCGYIASLLSASITMLVTAKMHTEKVAIFIPMFIFGVLFYLMRPICQVTNVGYFMPAILINMDNNATKYLVFFQIGNLVFRLIPFVMVLYVVVTIILLPFIYKSYSGYDCAKNLRRKSRRWNRVSCYYL